MGYILILLIILSLSGSLAVLGNRKIEETTPVTMMSIIMLIYICGLLFHNIPLGVYLSIGFSVPAIAFLIFTFIKRKKLFMEHCITPGFFILLSLFLWMFIININRLAFVWDEMSHWALAVKNMCFFDYFSFIDDANTTYKGYPPAITLWEYFVCKLTGGYSDSGFYNAYSWFLLSLCIPFVKKFKFKQMGYAIASVLFIIFLPLAFNNTYMVVGYVDIPLGVLSFYIIFELYTAVQKNWYHYFSLFIAISTLCMIKATGVTFAIIILFLILGDMIHELRAKSDKWKPYTFSAITCSLGIIFGKFSWTLLLKVQNVTGAWDTSNFTLQNLLLLLSGKGDEYWYETIRYFFFTLFLGRFGKGIIGISVFFWTVLLITIAILLSRKKDDRKRFRRYIYTLLVGEVIYIFGLLFLYIFTFSAYEAVVLASFNRYMLSYMVILFFFILAMFIYQVGDGKELKWDYVLVLVMYGCLLLVVPFKQLLYVTVSVNEDWEGQRVYREKYSYIHKYDEILDYTKDKVAIIAQEDYGEDYYTINYEIAPVKVLNLWSLGQPYSYIDFYSVDYSVDEWLDYLVSEGCTYVYLHETNDYFMTNYAEAFENPNDIKVHNMYKIDAGSSNIRLVSID